jgi:hypothetical protein
MLITVNRIKSDDDTTISTVSVDDRFVCFGLEDEFRVEKVVKETRIPSGHYRVGLHTAGSLDARYRVKFPDFHRGMLHILDVPNFEAILIHIGNTDEDTAGCLLVGSGAVTQPGDMSLQGSTDAYKLLYPMVVDAAAAGQLESEFIDSDR